VAAGQDKTFNSAYPGSVLWWLDDDIDLCRQMVPRLRRSGWQVRTFHRPEQMLAALQDGRPDLLVLDQRLPDHLGTQLLHDLRRAGQSFPVLMLSAMGSAADRIHGLEQGAQDYLVKPFHAREMLLRCEQLLRISQHLAVSHRSRNSRLRSGRWRFAPTRVPYARPEPQASR